MVYYIRQYNSSDILLQNYTITIWDQWYISKKLYNYTVWEWYIIIYYNDTLTHILLGAYL